MSVTLKGSCNPFISSGPFFKKTTFKKFSDKEILFSHPVKGGQCL